MITAVQPSSQPAPEPDRTAAQDRPEPGWQRLWREAIRDPLELLARLGHDPTSLSLAGLTLADAGMRQFPLRVPRGFAARMRPGDLHDPLLRQVLPLDGEDRFVPGFGLDAVGDGAARGATGVIHKYHGRALLVATGSCAVHCRYCFRRHFPYAEETAAANQWQSTLDYLRQHPDISELILSGGDPLSLATAKLAELGEALADFPQITRLRLHSRLPIVLPERVDAALLDWLASRPQQTVVVVHANHANEIDARVDRALRELRQTGATVLNQSVLLRGVNDCVEALSALSERLFVSGTLPYYLHQLDRVAGTAHFEVTDDRARDLHAQLAARLPGYLVPKLVREIAGEPNKSAL